MHVLEKTGAKRKKQHFLFDAKFMLSDVFRLKYDPTKTLTQTI